MKRQADSLENEMSQLQSENKHLQESTQHQNQQIEELKQEVAEITESHQSELNKLKEEHEHKLLELQKKFAEKEQEYEAQIKEYGDLEGQILDLQGHARVSDDSIDVSTDKAKIYQEEIEELINRESNELRSTHRYFVRSSNFRSCPRNTSFFFRNCASIL